MTTGGEKKTLESLKEKGRGKREVSQTEELCGFPSHFAILWETDVVVVGDELKSRH